MSTTQSEVYECIRDELLFQEAVRAQICQDSRMDYYEDQPRSVVWWLLLFKSKYDDMVYSMSHEAGSRYALGQLRELAASCLQCIMEHDAYIRQSDGTLLKMNYPQPITIDLAWDVAVCERAYQDVLRQRSGDSPSYPVSGYLVMFDSYRRKAFDAWTDDREETAERIICKILGIIVHCMEDHGAPRREWDHVRRP